MTVTTVINTYGGTISASSSVIILIRIVFYDWKCGNSLTQHQFLKYVFYLNLAITDLLDSTVTAMGDIHEHAALCNIQAILIQIGGVASYLLLLVISTTLLYLIRTASAKVKKSSIVITIILIWVLSIIGFAVPPGLLDSYGPVAQGTCWIHYETVKAERMRFLFYIPLWTCMIWSSFVCLCICSKIKQKKEVFIQLGLFPLILLVCFLPPTTHRIWNWKGWEVPDSLVISHSIGATFEALFNSIVMWWNLVGFPCCKRCTPSDPPPEEQTEETNETGERDHNETTTALTTSSDNSHNTTYNKSHLESEEQGKCMLMIHINNNEYSGCDHDEEQNKPLKDSENKPRTMLIQ